jgi:hypothetical protein
MPELVIHPVRESFQAIASKGNKSQKALEKIDSQEVLPK